MGFIDKAREFFHLSIPVVVEEGKVIVPSFEIPLDPELQEPSTGPICGTIAIEAEDDKAVVKVALKKKVVTPKSSAKKRATVKRSAQKTPPKPRKR